MISIPRNSNPSIQYEHTLTKVNRAGSNTNQGISTIPSTARLNAPLNSYMLNRQVNNLDLL
jgi:hypothetical protein